jgi:hypothetical protein
MMSICRHGFSGYIGLLVWICLPAIAGAQDVIYSAYEKFDARSDDFAVVGKSGSRLYTYRTQGGDHFLDGHNENMDKLATVNLDFFPTKIYETRFIARSQDIVVLYQAVAGNKVIQYAALLDDMGRLTKGPLQLSETKTGILGPTKDYYSSAVSDDKKTIVVYSANTKGGNLDLEAKVIDEELNVSRRIKAVYKNPNSIERGEVIAGNDGTLYLPVYTPIGNRSYADQLLLLSLKPGDGNRFTVKELPLNDNYASRVYMKIDNANARIYVGGFYSGKKSGNFDGVLYTWYDLNSGDWQNKKMIPFDSQIRNQTGERNTNRAFNDFQIKQLIVKNDGGFVMISEESFVTSRTGYSPGFGYYSWYYPAMSQNIREYHFNDILALSYSGEGQREWYSFVRKEQYSQEDGGRFSSYAFLNSGGSLGFLFNDYDTRQSRIQLATVDAEGKQDKLSFTAEGNENPDWLPKFGRQVGSRELLIPCLRKKQICFAKVVF